MTTLGSMFKGGKVPPQIDVSGLGLMYLDIPSLVASLAALPNGAACASPAIIAAFIEQDDDAHEPCSLVACRAPLHPGPCKGWKHTLHSVSPGTYHQVEAARVQKANTRRLKRIADLKAQGKPIPRRLLTEIKAKPAPAHSMTAMPLGQVNQKADLAGGQAHHAGQAVSNAAGVKVNTAPLPLGPKQKKPSVAGRGPAFVITQPKVTDTYKLDKAAKITPQEWDALPSADKKAIRDELEAIKVRGFGPQQTKARALLALLPAANTVGSTLKPGTPGTITTPSGKVHQVVNAPSNAPGTGSSPAGTVGKVSLGQAVKTVPPAKAATPQLPASTPSPQRGTKDSSHGVVSTPKVGGSVSSTSVGLPSGYRISRDGMGYSLTYKAPGSVFGSKIIRTSSDQKSLEEYAQKHHDLAAPILAKHKAAGTSANAELATLTPDKVDAHKVAPVAAPTPTPAAPASSPVPAVLPAHVQAARAVAARTFGGAPTSKKHLTAYGQLSKADFDHLDATTQKTIRDDLANAKAKFLDPKKKQEAADLLDRFGSRHPAPASSTTPPAAPGGAKTYTVTYNGKTITRSSNKPYTHASVVRWSDGTEEVASFHTSENAALKGVLTAQQKAKGAQVIKAVAVKADTGTPNAPAAVPSGPKGYSDPMNQAVKAAQGADVDEMLKRVGALSHASIGDLSDADRKQILTHLDYVATRHAAQAPKTAAKAAALKRLIEAGKPQGGAPLDHEPSISELYAEELKNAPALAVTDALKAADDAKLPRDERVKALGALSKAQFDALKPDEQRKITDALQDLHHSAPADTAAEAAITKYTGLHPGVHRMRQAESDFRTGKIDAVQLRREFLHARVQTPSKYGDTTGPGALLAKEAQRIAEDNPKLPLWTRSELIDNPYNSGAPTYSAIARASNEYDWAPAPRLSQSDIHDIFRATDAELASSHPIHAEAVKALRDKIVTTGLAPGTPWSTATKNQVVDNLLRISGSEPEVSDERLKMFNGLSAEAQVRVGRVLRQRITDQTNDHAKTGTYLALHRIDGTPPFTPQQHAAVLAAAERFSRPDLDTYRDLNPREFDDLPMYVRDAIDEHLKEAQTRAERSGPVGTWNPGNDPLQVFPRAISDRLNGMRTTHANGSVRDASDVANFGAKIINPYDRARAYQRVPIGQYRNMPQGDQDLIAADLDKIAADTSLNVRVRYLAQATRDLNTRSPNMSTEQFVAAGATDPSNPTSDNNAQAALGVLSKAEYDSMAPAYRDAIDERVKALPGMVQQSLTAKFHPAAPQAATPAGMTPTTGTPAAPLPPHVQAALDTIYGVHASGKSHTMAHQLTTYGALRGNDFAHLNGQEQGHLLGDLSFIATTAKGPSADKARKLIDRFTPAGTPAGQIPPGAVIPPANSVPGQVRYATPLKGLEQAKDSGTSGDRWITLPGGGRVWGAHGAAGLLLQHVDPQTGEKRYLMVQRGPAISDPGKWTFPGGASDSKETPHQGAARETIEELGLKDDALKDALVHGDHTFSVPGHSWQYTTVAAQVPTMIKPNLTTAHARAETSDAKWMTIDEIRALDKAGDLHGPIAGGKLEANVISLYPQGGSGQTLGQIVRPGPVTKRQGRLRVPQGGRQAPNAPPNAWTAPHKPSKGKNLIPDKAAFDAQRQKIKQDRTLYDGKTADARLAAIGAQQGYDDTPTVVDQQEMDRLLATGDYIEAWRGVSGSGGSNWRGGRSGGKTAKEINEEMRTGPAYYGKGIFGNGYYLATQKRVAQQYADGTKGSVVRILIPKSAVTEKYDKVSRESHANPRTSKAKGGSYEDSTFYDPGRLAAAKGLDGIEIEAHHRSPGGGAGHVAAHGRPAFNWLNRSVLIVQKEPG